MILKTLMNSALQPQGVFFLFGGITIIGFFFIWFFIKDTTGLSDKQKKNLYSKEQVERDSDQERKMMLMETQL